MSPSPKFHNQLVGLPVEVSVKVTVKGMKPPGADVVKLALGGEGGGGGDPPEKQLRIAPTRSAFVEAPSARPPISKEVPKVR